MTEYRIPAEPPGIATVTDAMGFVWTRGAGRGEHWMPPEDLDMAPMAWPLLMFERGSLHSPTFA